MSSEVFKEQWTYFKAHPIRWIFRWLILRKDRPKLQSYLDWTAQEHGLSRDIGETDESLRERLMDQLIWEAIEKQGDTFDITRLPNETSEEYKNRINNMDIFKTKL